LSSSVGVSVVEELVVMVMVTLVSTDKINVNNIDNDNNIVFLDILS
jgi:hypothetical protein